MILPAMLARSRHRLTSHSCFGILLSLVAVLSALGCSKGTDRANESGRTSVTLREGDYLSSAYIDQVKKTRSPLLAGSQYGPHLVTVNRHGNLLHLDPIYNFHEGGATFVLHPDGSITVPEPNSPYISNLAISLLSQDSFRLGFNDVGAHASFKTDYVFVQDADAYIAKIVLVGTYKDRHGLNYEFGEDGWAVFPDRKFKFEIGTDHVLTGFDYFMDKGQAPGRVASSVIAFKWDGRMLQLFRTKEDENGFDEILDRRPYLLLQLTR
ncbi:MAG TPA: hypothetical protein VF532_22660 [Candidatus Angelobacter sp.]